MELVKKLLKGDIQALSRLISIVENNHPKVPEIIKKIHPYLGKSSIIGITGLPGAGKSTLVDSLTRIIRKKGLSVGIIAVDPTSPFTGGAVLGDRVRMQQHYLDPGVFIRSMATRGSRGGLPSTTRDVIKLIDAFGKDVILIETVGVGQTELDIIDAAETILVVLVPETGDAIQTMKAGLLEIATIFVINKSDRENSDKSVLELEALLEFRPKNLNWKPSIILTQAINNIGTDKLYRIIEEHQEYLKKSGTLRKKRKLQYTKDLIQKVEQMLHARFYTLLKKDKQMKLLINKIEKGKIDSYSAAKLIENKIFICEKGSNI